MQRNAKNHLSKADSAEFQQRWRALRDTWDEPIGITQFEDLCQRFDHDYPAFMTELRKKPDHYLAFLKYPDAIRRSLSTTNVVEAVNGQLEIIRRNSGGYFQSQDTVKLKLGITITSLENGRWAKLTGRVETCLHHSLPSSKRGSNPRAKPQLRALPENGKRAVSSAAQCQPCFALLHEPAFPGKISRHNALGTAKANPLDP